MDTKWEITKESTKYKLNFSSYTSIYNVQDTREEEIVQIVYDYFQPRSKSDETVKIYDQTNDILIGNKDFQAYYFSNDILMEEFGLSASTIMNKKLSRLLSEDAEVGMYLNTVNSLLEDSLNRIQDKVPIRIDPIDYKKLLKMLKFDLNINYDTKMNYIEKLELILPLLIEEIKISAKSEPIIIYNHPETYLSPNEQKKFREILAQQNVKLIVLTESSYFLSKELKGLNIYRNNKQMMCYTLLEDIYWNAPLNFEEEDIKESLEKIFRLYVSKFEITPVITNYHLGDIILFEPVDIYVCISFLQFCNYDYEFDLKLDLLPEALVKYINTL
ncbi:hypothetical protein [Macrococcus armenti]|uniref:hypothetical protein n=1 Tax=Macrococcus armenti TaxID=2875764 RepID=UPI001CCC9A80|nr:hypothetical protein [Macrococcus armenti]UBH15080.1 hypothetical protein LAU44_10120 [Macrococcus armenti]UBH17441.1 hypothetical protein LAU39_10150 [Macrococcus armenti]UBH19705.1 hypothetical protein LAU40_10125 [Macrococcus armenti]